MPEPGHRRHRQHHDAHQRRRPAVADLDHGGEVQRREPLPIAEGPVIAASHSRAGDANDSSEHDQAKGQDGSGPGQAAKEWWVSFGAFIGPNHP